VSRFLSSLALKISIPVIAIEIIVLVAFGGYCASLLEASNGPGPVGGTGVLGASATESGLHSDPVRTFAGGALLCVLVTYLALILTVRFVTEPKGSKTEAADRFPAENEERFRFFFENIPDPVFLHDVDVGSIIDANDVALKAYGYRREEIVRLTPRDLSPPENAVQDPDRIQTLREQGEVIFETVHQTSKGRVFPVEIHSVFMEHEKRSCAITVCRDITERKQVEEALEESERRLRTLMGNLPGMAYRCSNEPDWPMEFVSEGAFDLTGYSSEQLVRGEEIEYGHLIHPDDRQMVWDAVQESVGHGSAFEIEYRIFDREGCEKWVWERGLSVPSGRGGDRPALEGFVTDIDDREQAKRALIESELERTIILDSLPDQVVLQDLEKRVIWANRAACEAAGLSRQDVIDRLCFEVWEHRSAACEECPVEQSIANGESQNAVVVDSRERVLKIQGCPIRNERGEITRALEITKDITERRKVETERTKLEEQLRQAQKMEAIGQLAGGVAHDFNNMLQAIQGYSQLLLEVVDKGGDEHEFVSEIFTGTERAAALTRQLLAFSRRQVLETKNIELNEVVLNLLKMIGRTIGEHIELMYHPTSEKTSVLADPGQVEQVLMNLCVNARDAMLEGGKLIIETAVVCFDDEYCEMHPWAEPRRYVMFSVSDNGCGMDDVTQRRIFEPFFTTKETGKGTGLGLSTVFGIVTQHEGLLQVYSEVDHGTTFRIYLPSVETEAIEQQVPSLEEAKGGSETILLAEDDLAVSRLTTRLLQKSGYTVISAGDGEEAIEIIERRFDEIDLVLVDVVMPKKSGKDVFQRYMELAPHGRVLFMSGYSVGVIDNVFLERHRLNFIAKPFSINVLLTKIREILD